MIPFKRLLGAAALGCAAATLSAPVQADDKAMRELLRVLRDNGTINQQAYEVLIQSASSPAKPAEPTVAQEQILKEEVKKEVDALTQNMPEVNTHGKLEIKSRDGNFKWRLKGRIHAQGGVFNHDIPTTRFEDNAEIRRARLALVATLWKDWGLKLQYDFTKSGAAGLRDTYLSYKNGDFWPLSVKVGQFKEFLGLESLSSSNASTFIGRAMTSRVFSAPDARRIGFGVTTYGHDLWTLGAGVYGRNASNEGIGGVQEPGSDPLVLAARVTLAPIHTDDAVLHFGASGSYLKPSSLYPGARFRVYPEAHNGTTRLIDTGIIGNINNLWRYGAEFLGMIGPVYLQGEYQGTTVNRKNASDLTFDGGYVYAGWVLTGEHRIYEFKKGIYKNPKPEYLVGQGGIGAWELAVRFSSLNLTDRNVVGGQQRDFTAGLNWYPIPNMKFMANYIKVLEVRGGQYAGDNPEGFLMRAQVTW